MLARRHHRAAARHRFERRQSEALVAARRQKHRRRRVQPAESGIGRMKCKGQPRGQAARPHGTAQLDANVRKAIADVRQRIDSIGCAFARMVVLQHEHGAFVPFTVGKKQCVVDAAV